MTSNGEMLEVRREWIRLVDAVFVDSVGVWIFQIYPASTYNIKNPLF